MPPRPQARPMPTAGSAQEQYLARFPRRNGVSALGAHTSSTSAMTAMPINGPNVRTSSERGDRLGESRSGSDAVATGSSTWGASVGGVTPGRSEERRDGKEVVVKCENWGVG